MRNYETTNHYKEFMNKLITFLLLFISFCIVAQPEIKFDTIVYDYGTVTESSKNLIAKFRFTNIGDKPLIVSSVRTSDGGLATHGWAKDSIIPGKQGWVELIYHGKRIGKINKTAVVTSNAPNNPYLTLRVKGEILLKETSISMDKNLLDIGTIPYGEIAMISFLITNTGDAPLYFEPLSSYPSISNIDVFRQNISLFTPPILETQFEPKNHYGRIVADPNEKIQVQIYLRNNFGNVGEIERNFYYQYNSHDTLKVVIKVNYTEKPFKDIIYEQNCSLEYQDGKLTKRTEYHNNGTARRIDDFQDGHLFHSIQYNYIYDGNVVESWYEDDLSKRVEQYKIER